MNENQNDNSNSQSAASQPKSASGITTQDQVKVGQIWTVKDHAGNIVRVKVLEIYRQTAFLSYPKMIRYECLNLKTGYKITVKSAAKFRRLVEDVKQEGGGQ